MQPLLACLLPLLTGRSKGSLHSFDVRPWEMIQIPEIVQGFSYPASCSASAAVLDSPTDFLAKAARDCECCFPDV